MNRIVAICFAVSFSLCLLCSSQAKADKGLYASAPPAGSAFVRFISGEGGNSLKGNVRGKDFPIISLGHVGAYLPVSPGNATISLGSASVTHNLKPGNRYSAILRKGKLSVLEEPVNDNKLKTQIILLNLSSEKDVSLKTADGSLSVINAVAPGTLGARPVNAVRTGFAVYTGQNKITSIDEKSLERGSGYAVVVYDGSGGPAVSFDQASGS